MHLSYLSYTNYINQQAINEKTKFHFIGVLQLINEEGITDLEYHHFENLSKSMDIGMNHQYLPIS